MTVSLTNCLFDSPPICLTVYIAACLSVSCDFSSSTSLELVKVQSCGRRFFGGNTQPRIPAHFQPLCGGWTSTSLGHQRHETRWSPVNLLYVGKLLQLETFKLPVLLFKNWTVSNETVGKFKLPVCLFKNWTASNETVGKLEAMGMWFL